MQVSVESGEGLERRMRVDLSFDQIAVEVDKRLQQLARSARLPGFRPGKVPMKVLRQRFADRVQQEVFGELVQSSYMDALTQESLRPVGMPRIEPEIDLDGKSIGFTAIFEVMPEFELASLSQRTLRRPVCELTDTDLDQMIERLRDQHKTWNPVERPCQQGDRVTLSFTGTVEGEAFEGGSNAGLKIELGSGRMIPGFEDGLLGASVGEQRTLDLTFPDPYQAAHLAGKPVRFDITLDGVEESRLPDVDAEFAKVFGVEDGDLERFLADVRANMQRELSERLDARIKESVIDLLIETNPIDVPNALVQSEIQSMTEQMGQMLDNGKMNLPASLFEAGARRRVALGLIFGQIVKEYGLQADPERVREMVEHVASTYEHPQELIDYYYGDRERLSSVESMVLEGQVVELVMGQVIVEDETVSFAELTSPTSAT